MKSEVFLDEVDYLVGQLERLGEAQEMASTVSTSMLSKINNLQDQIVRELRKIFERILGRKAFLGASPPSPKYSLEFLERLFAAVRGAAEAALARASKMQGTQHGKMMTRALDLADITRATAMALKLASQERGEWSADYIERHGLGPWI